MSENVESDDAALSGWLRSTGGTPSVYKRSALQSRDSYQRAKAVRHWRASFARLAKEARVPRLDAIEVTVVPYLATRRGLQDVGGCLPAAKAAIDGLVDARVLADDTPDHLVSLTFKTPIIGKGDALELVIAETPQ